MFYFSDKNLTTFFCYKVSYKSRLKFDELINITNTLKKKKKKKKNRMEDRKATVDHRRGDGGYSFS